jgi:hypothetical protein
LTGMMYSHGAPFGSAVEQDEDPQTPIIHTEQQEGFRVPGLAARAWCSSARRRRASRGGLDLLLGDARPHSVALRQSLDQKMRRSRVIARRALGSCARHARRDRSDERRPRPDWRRREQGRAPGSLRPRGAATFRLRGSPRGGSRMTFVVGDSTARGLVLSCSGLIGLPVARRSGRERDPSLLCLWGAGRTASVLQVSVHGGTPMSRALIGGSGPRTGFASIRLRNGSGQLFSPASGIPRGTK